MGVTHCGECNNEQVIKFEKSCHWYSKDKEACHDADLRVARKQFLYPSTTTVYRYFFNNDFLDRWKMNQLVEAASSNFKQPHETPEDYANRLYELSREKASTAADFGKKIHAAIESYPAYPSDEGLRLWVDKFGEWYTANVEAPMHRERVLLDHDLGVAGTCDFIGLGKGAFDSQVIIPDWKTQDVKKDKKGRKVPAFYESWPRQLGFYAVAYAKEAGTFPDNIPTCLSVVIDSNEPETPFVKVWSKEEIMDNYYDFVAGAYLWFSKRSYWPQANGKWSLNPSIPMPLC
jgi:hypothetical protein